MGIEERVAVITGAAGGLGRVAAQELAQRGLRLALAGSSEDKLVALAQELDLPQERWLAYAADLTQPAAAPALLEAVKAKFGRADILLHFVGGWLGGKAVPEVTSDEVANMLQQHLWSTFYLAQVFAPHMLASGWGRLIVISSPHAGIPPAKGAPYTIGKASQEALMLTLAEELKYSGVTANVLRVKTIDVQHESQRQPSSKNASWTTPEEITAAIMYLCSDAAQQVNGARLPLYGGQ